MTRRFSLLLLALIMMFAAAQSAVEIEERVFELSRNLRCPVCTSESIADSNAQISIEMRNTIQQKVSAGETDAQIYAYFQDLYGDWVMLSPPKRGIHLFVWLLPVIAGIIGVAALVLLVRRWLRTAATPIEADPDDIARVLAELEKDANS